MPEPEFFILLLATAAVFGFCFAIAAGLFFWGVRRRSKALKIFAVVVLIPGLIVFIPMFILLLMWIWYWMFGSNIGPSQRLQPAPSEKAVKASFLCG